MKKTVLLILLIGVAFFGNSQTKTEYLSIKVQHGLKTSGFVEDIWVDIGKSGKHSLSGEITNKDGVVEINGRKYKSEIDVLNYFAEQGWVIVTMHPIKILNEEYYFYILKKDIED